MDRSDASGDDLSTEALIANMGVSELQELLVDMGLEATEATAAGVKELVERLGSLEAAIIAVTDDQVMRRAG